MKPSNDQNSQESPKISDNHDTQTPEIKSINDQKKTADDDKTENILAFEKNTAANKDEKIIEEQENDDDLIIINTKTPKSIKCVSLFILKIDETFQ